MSDQTWVIYCWVYGQDQYTDSPDCTLGPYSNKDAAELAATKLTCTMRVERFRWRLNPPEWATS
jgi:hypothetical protein